MLIFAVQRYINGLLDGGSQVDNNAPSFPWKGMALVYDVTNMTSFENVTRWLETIEKVCYVAHGQIYNKVLMSLSI